MTYIMSDIHGESDRFFKMLELIHFEFDDHLYILGDVIDRGPDGISLIQFIMEQKNISLILGNHEYMFFDAVQSPNDGYKEALWLSNGGYETFSAYKKLGKKEQIKILDFIENLPDHIVILSHGQDMLLVHGSPGDSTEQRIWERPNLMDLPLLGDTVVVVGHTPTIVFNRENSSPMSIYYNNKFIDVDCGCGHSTPLKRLACLRLDDMREFYI